MKYYRETDVKEMIDFAIAYGTDITNYCPSLDDYPSIEIKEPHGDLIDRDALMDRHYYFKSLDGRIRAVVALSDIENAPTVLGASE